MLAQTASRGEEVGVVHVSDSKLEKSASIDAGDYSAAVSAELTHRRLNPRYVTPSPQLGRSILSFRA
jgi:hypothetical protein